MKRRDSQPTIWPIEPHTQAKHEILRRYLDGWFPILARWNGRVVFLDGFAGPGVYAAGEPGSPLIALRSLLGRPDFARFSRCEFIFMFIEPDEPRRASLAQQILDLEARSKLPSNVTIEILDRPFEKSAESLLMELERQRAQLAPTFAFIDPFGFTGLPLDLIRRLLSFDKCEVFVNFMIGWVNRFVDHPDQQANFEQLFATDRFAEAARLSGRERLDFLRELYQSQLSAVAGFRYVKSFEMVHHSGHTGNVLFYGTRNLEGLRVMKAAMWQVDPGGGIAFSDRLGGQEILFGGANVDLHPLRQALLDRFVGTTVRAESVREYVLADTPYADTHWNRGALVPLEKEGRIEVVTSRAKRYTFPPGTRIRFRG
jgi:three-Cys-motif partner protein